MSIVTDARSYADTTLDQGKSTLNTASERLFSLTSETRDLAKGVITLARKQAHVSIGVSDAILAVITKRSQELPGEAKDGATKLVDGTKERINQANELAGKAQERVAAVAEDLRERGSDVVDAARKFSLSNITSEAKVDLDARVTQVKDAINKLADRGEQVAADLRHDPVVVRLISDADKGVETVANSATSVAQKLRSRAAAQAEQEVAATTSTPVRLTPASKVPTHKTTVRKTPAGEAPISTTPTHRAAAEETAIRKEAARKAAATRKAAAEEAAAKRKEAAAKAAAKRKEAAEARQQAAEIRKAAALKAAETRRENAEARQEAAEVRRAAAVKAAETRKENAAKKSADTPAATETAAEKELTTAGTAS